MAEVQYIRLEEEAIQIMRQTTRKTVEFNRRQQREDETDSRRDLPTIRIESEPLENLVKKIKNRSITPKELSTLKNSMIHESHTIPLVLSEHGALQGLVRELTATNAEKQYQAIGCLCNLAIGDNKARTTVAKHAGPYVILTLDSLNLELKKLACWTLCNLADSPKACDIVVPQGAVSKLADIVRIHHNMDVKTPAIQALIHFCLQLKSALRQDHMMKIQEALIHTEVTQDTLRLMFSISCHKQFKITTLPSFLTERYFKELCKGLENYSINKDNDSLMYLLRFYANSDHMETYGKLLVHLQKYHNVVKQILEGELNENMLWLLGNMWRKMPDRIVELLE